MDVVSVCLVVRCFLSGGLDRITVKRRGIVLWTVFSAAFLTLLDIAVIGSLGAGLTSVLTLPFFTLVRNLVFFNAVERVEAFLVALWVFPDMLFVSALLRCMGDNVSAVVSDRKKSHYIFAGLAGLTLLLSLLMGYDQQLLAQMSEKYIPAANIVLSVGLFSAVCAIICGKAEE